MTDGNTYAINKRLDEREDYDALQEVTAELEQAHADLEQAEARIEGLKATLVKAEQFIVFLDENHRHVFGVTARQKIRELYAELKGQDDE